MYVSFPGKIRSQMLVFRFFVLGLLWINVAAKHPFHFLAANATLHNLFDPNFVLLLRTPNIYASGIADALRLIGAQQNYNVFPTTSKAPAIWDLSNAAHERLAAMIASTSATSKYMFVERAYFHSSLYSLLHTSKEQLIVVLQDPIYSYLPQLRQHGCDALRDTGGEALEVMSHVVVGSSPAYMNPVYHASHERALKLIRHMRWLPVVRERHEDSMLLLRHLLGAQLDLSNVVDQLLAEEREVSFFQANNRECMNMLRRQLPYDMALYTTAIETLDHWMSLIR